jgi:signal transduction histidine kinase
MARLQDVSTQLVHGSALLDEILDSAIAIIAADKGNIQLVDPIDGSLRLIASKGFDAAFNTHFAIVQPGQGTCGSALSERGRVVCEDITTSRLFAGTQDLEVLRNAGVAGIQSTPLVARSGRIVGVLSTHYAMPRRPADRDLRMLDVLARQAADWIERQEGEREREQLLERERKAREEAEQAMRAKDDFLATLSHELRSPLGAIIGWTDIIRADLTDVQRVERGIEVISRSVRTQSQLVSDLLDLSRIIMGKMRLNVTRVQLPEVIDAAIEAVRPAAKTRGIRLETVVEPVTDSVHGDAARMQQIVWNLLSNAVKFTPEGGRVQLVLARINSHVEITVSDTGKGIQPDFLPHVFERFRQENTSSTREHGGLGIGLALVKELTELHGGSVTAHSDGEGCGSTFTLKLPVAIAQPVDEPRVHPRAPSALSLGHLSRFQLGGVRVLVVDDEPDGLEVMQRILLDRGLVVTAVRGADEALDALAQHTFDVVLSDIGMPKRDGYDLIAEVRRRGISTPAVAVTAFARSEDRTRALLAGYQTHIAKPIEASELLAIVASLAGRVTPGAQ